MRHPDGGRHPSTPAIVGLCVPLAWFWILFSPQRRDVSVIERLGSGALCGGLLYVFVYLRMRG